MIDWISESINKLYSGINQPNSLTEALEKMLTDAYNRGVIAGSDVKTLLKPKTCNDITKCENMKNTYNGFEGERYRCNVCGESYFLDYEEMK